jgi:hypothetical protein
LRKGKGDSFETLKRCRALRIIVAIQSPISCILVINEDERRKGNLWNIEKMQDS